MNIRNFLTSLSACLLCALALPSPAAAQDLRAAPGARSLEAFQVCHGVGGLRPTDVVAERRLSDGTLVEYRAAELPRLVEDFVRLMTTEHGWTEERARSDTFGNLRLAAEELCGGTKNCGAKACRKGGDACVYRSMGMSGCRCEGSNNT